MRVSNKYTDFANQMVGENCSNYIKDDLQETQNNNNVERLTNSLVQSILKCDRQDGWWVKGGGWSKMN